MSQTRSGSVIRCADGSLASQLKLKYIVVDGVVHRQVDQAVPSAFIELVMRPLVGRAFGAVDIPVLPEQLGAMAAARADRTAARNPFEGGNRLGQMILLERRLLRHLVLPHVI